MDLSSLSGMSQLNILPVVKKEINKPQGPISIGLQGLGQKFDSGLREMPVALINISETTPDDSIGTVAQTELEKTDTIEKLGKNESGLKADTNQWDELAKGVSEGVKILKKVDKQKKLTKKDIILIDKILKKTSGKLEEMNQFLKEKFGFKGNIKNTSLVIRFLKSLGKEDESISYLIDSYLSIAKDIEEYEQLVVDVAAKVGAEAEKNFANDKDVQKAVEEIKQTAIDTFGTEILEKINKAYQAQKALLEKIAEQTAIKVEGSSSSKENLADIKLTYNQTQTNAAKVEAATQNGVNAQKAIAKQDNMHNEINLNKRLMYEASMAA